MGQRTQLTTVDTVHDAGSWLFTVRDRYGEPEEVILVACEEDVQAWINQCPHEDQRLDRGSGVALRDGEIICPRHGSLFDRCQGDCDNGPAANTRLVSIDVAVEDDTVYLEDSSVEFDHKGGIEDDDADGGPASTSHIGF